MQALMRYIFTNKFIHVHTQYGNLHEEMMFIPLNEENSHSAYHVSYKNIIQNKVHNLNMRLKKGRTAFTSATMSMHFFNF